MAIAENLKNLLSEIPSNVKLIAVSKFKTNEQVMEAYQAGQRTFGENLVQELVKKYEELPKDIEWHLIGHLQTNKVKFIAPFVSMIHSVDSMKLLQEINKRAAQHKRVIDCLLQIYIAKEETKFGLSFEEAEDILYSEELKKLNNIKIVGLMGMASNMEEGRGKMDDGIGKKEGQLAETVGSKDEGSGKDEKGEQVAVAVGSNDEGGGKRDDGEKIIRMEFQSLFNFFNSLTFKIPSLKFLSMGMSSDYKIAIDEGSNMIRVGSIIFGERN